MKEHREPPRIVSGERRLEEAIGGSSSGGAGFRHFDFVRHPRQLHRGRIGLFILAAVGLLMATVYLGYRSTHAAFDWLHHQPQYQLPVEQIQLVPEPPVWFRGGKESFLDGVKHDAGLSDSISQLDVTPEQLADEFKKYPWVLDVEKVIYRPSAITVQIRYHQPVAFVQLPEGEQLLQILVDESGNIVRKADVEIGRLANLFKVTGKGLSAPSDPNAGHVWKTHDDRGAPDEPDRRVVAAAKLAGFLSDPGRLGEAKQTSAQRTQINVSEYDTRGLFVRNAEGFAIWWEHAPGDEPAGKPSAVEKWAKFKRWRESIADSDELPTDGDYLDLSGPNATVVCFHQGKPHRTEIRSAGSARSGTGRE